MSPRSTATAQLEGSWTATAPAVIRISSEAVVCSLCGTLKRSGTNGAMTAPSTSTTTARPQYSHSEVAISCDAVSLSPRARYSATYFATACAMPRSARLP